MSFPSHQLRSQWSKTQRLLYRALLVCTEILAKLPEPFREATSKNGKSWKGQPTSPLWPTIPGLSLIRRPSLTWSILLISWISILFWGERYAFTSSISACQWELWENWPPEAVPHRLVIVADPQLVDPHTYPGRPWPLSRLTVLHTDQYMRRAFTFMLDLLQPSTVYFLGDLFDGGREWSTLASKSPEKVWNKYDTDFWLQEYRRFGEIFFDPWIMYAAKSNPSADRKIISSLPGNHDLGIGTGIRLPVRARFSVFFGEGNRIDLIGNHTFVAVDTVSLTAKPQSEESSATIWQPAQEFLESANAKKKKTIARDLRLRYGLAENTLLQHSVNEANNSPTGDTNSTSSLGESLDIPTILISHVPFYRDPGTPCGPLRERWPPSKVSSEDDSLQSDDANAIRIAAGYQYQNVLLPELCKEIIEKVGDVEHIYSGDDHDYCETVHRGYTSQSGGVREITVKAFSWAMGVRQPGFLMLSLWNPVDESGRRVLKGENSANPVTTGTIQSHLCLLPNQLTVFIRYGVLLVITLLVLAIRTFRMAFEPRGPSDGSIILPLSRAHSKGFNHSDVDNCSDTRLSSTSSVASDIGTTSQAATRSAGPRIRANSLGGQNLANATSTFKDKPQPELYEPLGSGNLNNYWGQSRHRTKSFAGAYAKNFFLFASVPLLWYFWLARNV